MNIQNLFVNFLKIIQLICILCLETVLLCLSFVSKSINFKTQTEILQYCWNSNICKPCKKMMQSFLSCSPWEKYATLKYWEYWGTESLTRCARRGSKTKKNAWVWHLYFLKGHILRHLKKAEKKYSVFKNLVFFTFNFFSRLQKQDWK